MEKKQTRAQNAYDWLQSIVIACLVVAIALTFVGRRMTVQKTSMTPTLLEGDQMIVRSIAYTPSRGDIFVFSKAYFEEGAPLVKRVIALAGDVVDIRPEEGLVYVNGQALDEPFILDDTRLTGDLTYPYTVPEGHVFAMGDNRNGSKDSRSADIGPVDTREIIGKVVAVIYPFDRMKFTG